MPTADAITSQDLAAFRAATRRRVRAEARAVAAWQARAWALARMAAAVLREQFDADRVVVFGSLIHPGCFTAWSDVDIAAWGLRPEDTFRAIGAVMDLDAEIAVNLVDVATCKAPILRAIEAEGVPL